MKQLRQVAIVIAAACVLAMISGCETPGDTALLGGLLGGMAPYAKTAQGAASMAAMGNAASGYANAQASRPQVTVNNVQPSQPSSPSAGSIINVTNKTLDNGATYSGQALVKSSGRWSPHGKGLMRYPNGLQCDGEWDATTEEYQGWRTSPDGTKCWQKVIGTRQIKAEGTIVESDGRRKTGTWDFERGTGNGTIEFPDGRKYEGEWRIKIVKQDKHETSYYDICHGRGTLTGKDLKLAGEWRDDKLYNGTFWSKSEKAETERQFENGKATKGKDIWLEGIQLVGIWDADGRSGGTITWKDGREYKGDWKIVNGKPDLPDGEGTMTWSDGRKYVGEFRDGKMHGLGKMTYADGRIEEGFWKQDEFTGKQAVFGKSDNKPQTATSSGKQGTLTVDSVVGDCEVFVDGSFMGNTPAKLKLAEGAHCIEVKKDGYKPYKKDVTVSEGSELTLRPSLQKE